MLLSLILNHSNLMPIVFEKIQIQSRLHSKSIVSKLDPSMDSSVIKKFSRLVESHLNLIKIQPRIIRGDKTPEVDPKSFGLNLDYTVKHSNCIWITSTIVGIELVLNFLDLNSKLF